MDDQDRHLFLAESGPVRDGLVRFWADRSAALKKRAKLLKQLGSTGEIYGSDREIVAVGFPNGQAPAGWSKDRSTGLHKPDMKTQEGRAHRAALNDAKTPDYRSLYEYLPQDVFVETTKFKSGRLLMLFTVTSKFGEHYTLEVPMTEKPRPTPEGCRPLKLSEYYALKEEAQAAAGERKAARKAAQNAALSLKTHNSSFTTHN